MVLFLIFPVAQPSKREPAQANLADACRASNRKVESNRGKNDLSLLSATFLIFDFQCALNPFFFSIKSEKYNIFCSSNQWSCTVICN